jgi:dTDP-4-amino-4,6-dideoxygalactose transaminase
MRPGGAAARIAFGSLAETHRQRRAEIDAAIARVLDSGRFILGEEVAAVRARLRRVRGRAPRRRLRERDRRDRARAARRGGRPGDAAILPANACVPVIAAVRQAGLEPRLADVDAGDADARPRVRGARAHEGDPLPDRRPPVRRRRGP